MTGPACSHVFYDYLASHNQKTTLFYIVSNRFDWPYRGQCGVVGGHEVRFAELWYTERVSTRIRFRGGLRYAR